MNSFKERFPEYLPIEEHIRRARLERSLYIAELITGVIAATAKGLKQASARVSEILSTATPRRTAPSR